MYQLPGKYRTRHNYSIAVYDQILGLFSQIEAGNFLKVKINIKNDDDMQSFKTLKGEELFDWMLKHNYEKEIAELQYKECFAAVLSDMLQYILTALKCSAKGQLSVTYALLRKPLKDGLFYLEHLFVNPEDFLRKFNEVDNINSLAVDKRSPEEIMSIIKKAIEKLGTPIYDANAFYDLRFNKKNQNGFEPAFELANHLITKHDHYRTSEGNFNFVFSDTDAKESQWDFLYLHIPNIMFYLLSLVSSISSIIIKLPNYWPLLMAKYSLGLLTIHKTNIDVVVQHFQKLFDGFEGKCDSCGKLMDFNSKQFRVFEKRFSLKCMNCGKEYSLAEDAQQLLQPDNLPCHDSC